MRENKRLEININFVLIERERVYKDKTDTELDDLRSDLFNTLYLFFCLDLESIVLRFFSRRIRFSCGERASRAKMRCNIDEISVR